MTGGERYTEEQYFVFHPDIVHKNRGINHVCDTVQQCDGKLVER